MPALDLDASVTAPPAKPPASRQSLGAVSRVVGRPAFWVALLAVLFTLPVLRSVFRPLPPAPPVLATVPAFTMTDQTGHPFGSKDLEGKVWVADFIFTSC